MLCSEVYSYPFRLALPLNGVWYDCAHVVLDQGRESQQETRRGGPEEKKDSDDNDDNDDDDNNDDVLKALLASG